MDNANGLAEICEKCDEQKNSKLAELYIWKIMRCTMCILQLNFRYKFQTLQSISTTLQATTVWGASCMIFLIKSNKLVIHIICETIYNVILGALMQVWRRNKMPRARGHWKKVSTQTQYKVAIQICLGQKLEETSVHHPTC